MTKFSYSTVHLRSKIYGYRPKWYTSKFDHLMLEKKNMCQSINAACLSRSDLHSSSIHLPPYTCMYTLNILVIFPLSPFSPYCGWKKSCSTLDGWTPINNGMFYHLSTAGFRTHPPYSTVFHCACEVAPGTWWSGSSLGALCRGDKITCYTSISCVGFL